MALHHCCCTRSKYLSRGTRLRRRAGRNSWKAGFPCLLRSSSCCTLFHPRPRRRLPRAQPVAPGPRVSEREQSLFARQHFPASSFLASRSRCYLFQTIRFSRDVSICGSYRCCCSPRSIGRACAAQRFKNKFRFQPNASSLSQNVICPLPIVTIEAFSFRDYFDSSANKAIPMVKPAPPQFVVQGQC